MLRNITYMVIGAALTFLAICIFAHFTCFPTLSSPPEWLAAWVQALGSIIAIAAAVWIDRGSARRAENKILAQHSERIFEWRNALEAGRQALQEASDLPGRIDARSLHPDAVDPSAMMRIVQNASGVMDVYLQSEPPNPRLGKALVAMRNELMSMRDNVRHWSKADPNAHLLATTLNAHVQNGAHIIENYQTAL